MVENIWCKTVWWRTFGEKTVWWRTFGAKQYGGEHLVQTVWWRTFGAKQYGGNSFGAKGIWCKITLVQNNFGANCYGAKSVGGKSIWWSSLMVEMILVQINVVQNTLVEMNWCKLLGAK